MVSKKSISEDFNQARNIEFFAQDIPVSAHKLDADDYYAEDLDGVTESVMGSGNLNFLAMQAQDASEALSLNTSDPSQTSNDEAYSNTGGTYISVDDSGNLPTSSSAGNLSNANSTLDSGIDTARDIQDSPVLNVETFSSDGHFSNATVGSVGASTLSSDAGNFSGGNLDLSNLVNNGGDTSTSNETTIIQEGDENIEIIENHFPEHIIKNIHLGDLNLDLGDVHLGDINLGDIHLGDINIEGIVSINQLIENIEVNVGDIYNAVTTLTTNIHTYINNVLNIFGGDPDGGANGDTDLSGTITAPLLDLDVPTFIEDGLLNPVESLVGDIDAALGVNLDLLSLNGDDFNNANGDTDITLQTGIDLVDNTLLNQGLNVSLDPVEQFTGDIDLDLGAAVNILGDQADGLINEHAGGINDEGLNGLGDALADVTEDVLDVADDIVGIDGIDLDTDIDLLGGDHDDVNNAGGDSDLNIETGIDGVDDIINPVTDTPLDVVEGVIGDVDINADLGLGLSDDGGVEDTLLDFVDIGHNDDAEDSNGGEDTDIAISDVAYIDIDPVEEIVGDIDLSLDITDGDVDLDVAVELLGDVTHLNDTANDNQGIDDILGLGTEEQNDQGLFGDIINGGTANDLLPDPIGSVAEGIGGILPDTDMDVGSLGGLF